MGARVREKKRRKKKSRGEREWSGVEMNMALTSIFRLHEQIRGQGNYRRGDSLRQHGRQWSGGRVSMIEKKDEA